MNKHFRLAVIIVTYNSDKVILPCLNSIKRYNDIGALIQIVIVDNTPNGSKINSVIKESFPEIQIEVNEQNQGFGQANNLGATISEAEYMLFLNPDTILVEPIFRWTIEKFEENKKLALFGIKLININDRFAFSFKIFPHLISWITFFLPFNQILNVFNIFDSRFSYTEGADIFVRTEIFKEIGGFDKNFFMYFEEPVLAIKMSRLGCQNAFFKQKKMIHLEGKGSLNTSKMQSYLTSFEKYLIFLRIDPLPLFKKISHLFKMKSFLYFWHPNRSRYNDLSNYYINYANTMKSAKDDK